MPSNIEGIKICIANCDRWAKVRADEKAEREDYARKIAEGLRDHAETGDEDDEGIEFLKNYQKKNQRTISLLEFRIKLLKIEKQIFVSSLTKNGATLIPLFLSKFDETLAEIYSLTEERVREGELEEGEYLDHCKASCEQRNRLKDLCETELICA